MPRYDMARERPDDFQTNPWSLDCLVPYMNREWIVWECAAGKGNLVRGFRERGFDCFGSDVKGPYAQGPSGFSPIDFLTTTHPADCIVTNPPFTLKDQFLARCYEIGKPFALLMPLTGLESQKRQRLYHEHGIELIFLPGRGNKTVGELFETPSGKNSGSWFACAWYCGFFGLHERTGRSLIFNPPAIHTEPVASNAGKGPGFHSTRIAARERHQSGDNAAMKSLEAIEAENRRALEFQAKCRRERIACISSDDELRGDYLRALADLFTARQALLRAFHIFEKLPGDWPEAAHTKLLFESVDDHVKLLEDAAK